MKSEQQFECIDNSGFANLVKLNTPYTVRQFVKKGEVIDSSQLGFIIANEDGILLNEVISPDKLILDCWIELPFPFRKFRELQLPGFVSEILEKEFQLI